MAGVRPAPLQRDAKGEVLHPVACASGSLVLDARRSVLTGAENADDSWSGSGDNRCGTELISARLGEAWRQRCISRFTLEGCQIASRGNHASVRSDSGRWLHRDGARGPTSVEDWSAQRIVATESSGATSGDHANPLPAPIELHPERDGSAKGTCWVGISRTSDRGRRVGGACYPLTATAKPTTRSNRQNPVVDYLGS